MTERSKVSFAPLTRAADGSFDTAAVAKMLRDNIPTGVTSRGDLEPVPGRSSVAWHGRQLVLNPKWTQQDIDIHLNGFVDEIVRAHADEIAEDAARAERHKREDAERATEMKAHIESMIPLVCTTAAAVRKELVNKHGWSPGNGDVAILTALALMGALRGPRGL